MDIIPSARFNASILVSAPNSCRAEPVGMNTKSLPYTFIKIEECIEELEHLERELHKVLVGFIVEYFKKFYENL